VSLDSTHTKGDSENANDIFAPLTGKVYDFPFSGTVTVKKLNSREFLEKPMKLKATVNFFDLSYREVNKNYTYIVNGEAILNNKDLKFEALKLRTAVGEAELKGRAENFMNYILGYTDGFKANLAARTETLDLNPLFRKKQGNSSDNVAVTENGGDAGAAQASPKEDDATKISASHFEFNVQLFAKRLIARSVEATYANVDLNYKNDVITLKNVNVNACDGKISMKGTLQDMNKLRADVTVTNVNVNKLFKQFENFGQDAITSDNLQGMISLDAKFMSELDEKMEVIPESMNGEVRLKLKDGHLLNYEPVQSLSNFLFKNRDFNDISFSELSDVFHIQGYKMTIDELEVASNVLNLFVVNGIYNFKGTSNINLLIPWSNLKKRGKNYIPKNSGQSAENTNGLKLNFQGPKKNLKLTMGHKELEQ
jgi:hypothetical protein